MPGEKRSTELVPLTDEEIAELDVEEKRLEAWHLSTAEHFSMAKIARRFGVGPSTIGRWLDEVAKDRRSRAENIERETERLIAMHEAVAAKSWELAVTSSEMSPTTMAAPSHLKNVTEAAKEIARLRGIEGTRRESGGRTVTEVIVHIGGVASRPPVIDATSTDRLPELATA